MNKICTSLEQSKKLLELGVDVNTADMCWTNHLFSALLSSWRIESTPPKEYKNILDRFVVRGYLIEPAWSLSALLELMPNFTLNGFGNGQFNCRDERADCYALVDTCPFDAAFEMVVWLKENGKI